MSIPEKYIRECARKKKLNLSKHAMQRMGQREIKLSDIYDCICNGEMIESQKHGKDIKIVFQERNNQPNYYVVVAACYPVPEVVTVCTTLPEVWGIIKGTLKRR